MRLNIALPTSTPTIVVRLKSAYLSLLHRVSNDSYTVYHWYCNQFQTAHITYSMHAEYCANPAQYLMQAISLAVLMS